MSPDQRPTAITNYTHCSNPARFTRVHQPTHQPRYNAEVSGPLEEIGFWRSRTVDLSGISEQLLRSDVRKVSSLR